MERHVGRISVIAANENGVLSNLANAVARHDGGVSTLKIVNRQQDFMEVLMDVDVRDLRHLGCGDRRASRGDRCYAGGTCAGLRVLEVRPALCPGQAGAYRPQTPVLRQRAARGANPAVIV